VDQDQRLAVSLTKREWSIVQEALDNYYYEVEHRSPGGIRRTTKQRLAERREELLDALPRLDVAIYEQAGVGPLFGGA
jgi:hypothetical protein